MEIDETPLVNDSASDTPENTLTMSILTARRLAKRYGARTVVNDVSLTVQSGEVVGLLGPNGAGKTTSFYMIAGLVPPEKGTVRFDERDMSAAEIESRSAPRPTKRST